MKFVSGTRNREARDRVDGDGEYLLLSYAVLNPRPASSTYRPVTL